MESRICCVTLSRIIGAPITFDRLTTRASLRVELVLDVQLPFGRKRVDVSILYQYSVLVDGAEWLPPANLVTVHHDTEAVFLVNSRV
ncbi:MAG: hypothetical protein R3F19_05820 [Verrucomicrobiales bacterium]